MANPLFSTYSQGENRITAAILAVLERLSFALVEQILQALLQEPETQLLTFDNQPAGLTTVPDARIRASFSYWIETKRGRGAVREKQLRGHLEALDAERARLFVEKQRLLVLTPDAKEPDAVVGLDDQRVVWANFQDLVTAIEQALSLDETWVISEKHIPTERERELLRELVRLLNSERLLEPAQKQVLVVAARFALPEYITVGAYICQPNRSFQPSSHMAFYAGGRIHRRIPAIQGSVDAVTLSEEHVRVHPNLAEDIRERLLALVGRLRQEGSPTYGQHNKVIFLSSPQASETIRLPHDIQNDLVSESGRPIAFTQGHRYVPLASIQAAPETTTELLSLPSRERHRHSPGELVRFLNSEGLLDLAQGQVLVVAARLALPMYTTVGAYMCQPNRSFRPSSHMAFYAGGRIHRCIPVIQGSVDEVTLSEEHVRVRTDLAEDIREGLLALVGRLRQEGNPNYGHLHKVIFLSSPEAPETIHLAHDIRNDLVSQSGKAIAFVQGQRYVPLASILAAPETTTELLSLAAKESSRR